MRKTLTLFALLLAFVSIKATAQDRTITGKVTSSEDNLTVPGVSVVVPGTTVGTSTDMDGNFKIIIPKTAKALRFSSVGLKTKDVTIGAGNVLDVILDPDVLKLNEIVVTALGIEKETRSLGYSTTNVGGDQIRKSGEVNVVSGLSGKVAGIQITSSAGTPGASSKILLRGNKSFTGENQPLFVIDGVPLDNSTNATSGNDYPFNNYLEQVNYSNRAIDINPDDIESINVLKGPAAATLYGERGANGAIVITTKKAKYGQKTEVVVSSNIQWDQVNKLPDLQSTYAQGNGGGYTGSPGSYSTWTPGADDIYGTDDDNIGTANSWGPKISDLGMTSYNNPENFFKTGVTKNNSISISSGTDKNAYRLSVSHTDQTGIVPNTDFKRLSARLTAQSQLSQKISVGSTVNIITAGGNKAQQGSNLSGVMLSLLRAPASYDLRDGSATSYEHPNGSQYNYFAAYDNPYWSADNNTFNEYNTRILSNIALNYYPTNWLKFTWRPGIDTYNEVRKGIYAVGSNNSAQTLGGQISENTIFHQELYNDLLATLTHDFNKFSTTLIIGTNANQRLDKFLFSRGRNLAIRGFYNLGNASDLYADQTTIRRRSAALFADLSLGYDNTVFVGLTARQEWSSTFGVNKRTFFYPGANLSFVFTELKPLKGIANVLSFGKLRAAFATAAASPPAYSSINTYNKPFFTDGFTNGLAFPYLGQNGYGTNTTIGNPDLQPEETSGPELGIELKFFNDRLTFDGTYYNQTTKNILLVRPVPYSSGHSALYDNAGEMVNKGIELELGLIPIRSKKFSWSIDANYAANKNEVTKLAEGVDQIEIEVGFGDPGVFAKVGEPYGVLYGTTWERDASGNLIVDASGLPIPSSTLSKVGSAYPKFTAGIRNTFSYMNFTLSGLLDIRNGGDIWNGTQARLNRIGRSEESADREHTFIIPGVKEDGSANDIPVEARDYWQYYKGDFGATEEAIQDGGWVRLRELTLSYLITKVKFVRSIELSVSGRNLWVSTDYSGVDPETSLTGAGSNYTGIDWFVMPNTKSYSVGVKVTL
ncbi:MAG: SusC/RagA family TonB-linked outer membrane protein [Bacteroidia bacterium]